MPECSRTMPGRSAESEACSRMTTQPRTWALGLGAQGPSWSARGAMGGVEWALGGGATEEGWVAGAPWEAEQ